jgi:IclR family transcriptional regulator, KDG regulon repressor
MNRENVELVQTVERAIRIMNCFTKENPEWGVRELEKELEIGKSTVHRILQTLQICGFLTRSNHTGKYKLSLRIYELGQVAFESFDFLTESTENMKRLVKRFNETVYLSVRNGTEITYLGREDCEHPLRYILEIGSNSLLHVSAAGQAIMAFLKKNEIEEVIKKHGLPRFSNGQTLTRTELDEKLLRIREEGYALSYGGKIEGIYGIAVPIFSSDYIIGSLAFSIPEQRFDKENLHTLVHVLKEEASTISNRLGYR